MKYRIAYHLGRKIYYILPNDRNFTYLSSKWSGSEVKEEGMILAEEQVPLFYQNCPRFLLRNIRLEKAEDESRSDCQVQES
jgi:hypothetical protein